MTTTRPIEDLETIQAIVDLANECVAAHRTLDRVKQGLAALGQSEEVIALFIAECHEAANG